MIFIENVTKVSNTIKFPLLFPGPIITNVKGKRIILIDDSIVRGNTIGPIIRLLRNGGAKEVHVRVASPPLKYPCYMGINIPTKEELFANKLQDSKEFAEQVGKNLFVCKNYIRIKHHSMKSLFLSHV